MSHDNDSGGKQLDGKLFGQKFAGILNFTAIF
jgi:hypothetical protein